VSKNATKSAQVCPARSESRARLGDLAVTDVELAQSPFVRDTECDEKRRKWHGRLSGYRSSDLWIDHERNRESAGQAHANGADRRSARILADMSAQGAKPRRDGGGNARAQIGEFAGYAEPNSVATWRTPPKGTEQPGHKDPETGVDQTLGEPLQSGREARNFRQQEYRRRLGIAGVIDRMNEPTGCKRELVKASDHAASDWRRPRRASIWNSSGLQ
jgi:hypothetical protein